ncbi:MAG TPA: carboxypeptidase-like regulatory domain-containing protein, partial [Bacteroidales bacterium]|nr:carboxypeptidase-like regulatory domain-containing protein [Bacteroidales bacterium]
MSKIKFYIFLVLIFFLIISFSSFGQSKTFKGQVVDATNKEGVFRATISYSVDGFAQGVTSDDNGYFQIDVPEGIDSLRVSHISYQPTMKSIKFIKTKSIKIAIEPHASQIKEVVITAKKEKYTNKDNPAVELIRKVLDNREANSILNHCPLNYTSHNKSLIALDPVNDTVLARMKLKPVLNLMKGLETTYFESENYLPVYFFEELSQIYCKEGKGFESQRLVLQDIQLTAIMDESNARRIRTSIFTKIDLYQKYVDVLGNQFMSPVNSFAPQFYKFFIEDTLIVEGRECIKLSFIPRNVYDMGFMGYLFISNDENYEIISANFSITEKANVNFVDKIEFVQKFKTDTIEIDGVKKQISYITEDAIYAKIKFYTLKAYGYSINSYSKPAFEEYVLKQDKEIKAFRLNDSNRISPLTQAEKKTYQLPDSLDKISWFRVTKYLSEIFYGGYLLAGPVDIGPLDNLYSFNAIEGSRFRLSGKTNYRLSRRIYADFMLAYGTKD